MRRRILGQTVLLAAGFLLLTSLATVRGQDVVVETAEQTAEKARRAAELFNRPEEANSSKSAKNAYAPKVDWTAVPPWRQTSFYGIRAEGTFFVFVVDCSGSMADAERWLTVFQELRRTLDKMQFPQRYYVILYNDKPWAMPGGPSSAEKKRTRRTLQWIASVVPEGETDPRRAMTQALALRPHAVFLLSDGEYPDGCVDAIAKANTTKVPVHCIDVSGGAGGDDLKKIAEQSGGQYAARGRK